MPEFEQVQSEQQWIPAAEASRLLKPLFGTEDLARKTICKRAHNGLIRARAERLVVVEEGRDSQDVPKKFWGPEVRPP